MIWKHARIIRAAIFIFAHFLPTHLTDRGVGNNIILHAAYGVGSGLKLLRCDLHSLLANGFGKFLFTTIQFESLKNQVLEK